MGPPGARWSRLGSVQGWLGNAPARSRWLLKGKGSANAHPIPYIIEQYIDSKGWLGRKGFASGLTRLAPSPMGPPKDPPTAHPRARTATAALGPAHLYLAATLASPRPQATHLNQPLRLSPKSFHRKRFLYSIKVMERRDPANHLIKSNNPRPLFFPPQGKTSYLIRWDKTLKRTSTQSLLMWQFWFTCVLLLSKEYIIFTAANWT